MFNEICVNVAMETSERNCSNTIFNFYPKEKRTKSLQKAAGVRGAFPTALNAQYSPLTSVALRPCWADGKSTAVYLFLNRERTIL